MTITTKQTMRRAASVAAVGLFGGVALTSCVQITHGVNENHCANNNGDAWCGERYGTERAYCVLGTCGPTEGQDGCVAARPTDDECYSPCGDSMTVTEDGSCIVGEESSGSSSSGDGSSTSEGDTEEGTASTTTGPQVCMNDDECTSDAAPFCDTEAGECVGCDGVDDGDVACAELDPLAPACVDGSCVECTAEITEACVGATPVCDAEANACVACTEHSECGEAACNLFTGACLPAEAVVHVGPGQRFTTLGQAIGSFDAAAAEGTIVVHQADYNEAASVAEGQTLAFLANEGDVPRWILAGGGSPQLTVGNATVLMDGVQISGNASGVGLLVDGGQVWIDRGRIIDNNGGGLVAQSGAMLTVRNSFVGANGTGGVGSFGIDVDSATIDLVYVTVARNDEAAIDSIRCNAASTVTVRNSIVVGRDPESIDCPPISVVTSAVDQDIGDNSNVGAAQLSWFNSATTGDFLLTKEGAAVFENVAVWEMGDPAVDIDDGLRPTTDGASDYAGADVP